MNLYLALLLTFIGCVSSIYRGIATNVLNCQDLQVLSNTSWYYDYSLTPLASITSTNCVLDHYVEFVPIVWGSGSVPNLVANLPQGTKHLMAFNEPNFSSQSNLSPKAAATLWLNVEAQLTAAGLLSSIQLGAPSAAPGGDLLDPISWLTQFYGNCTGCHFSFQNFHIYDCNAPYYDQGAVSYWINQAYAVSKLPIWLTEFSCPNSNVTLELQWMKKVLPYLDSNPNVVRYAWFTARATNVGTAPSLLNSAPGSITAVGSFYNSGGSPLLSSNVPTASTTTTTAPITSTSTSTLPSSASTSTTASINKQPDSNNNSMAISTSIVVGVTVGVIGAVAIIVIAFVVYRRRNYYGKGIQQKETTLV